MRTFLASLLALLVAGLAAAQTAPSVADAFRNPAKSIPAAELPPSYRSVTLNSANPLGSLGIYGLAGMGMSSQSDAAQTSMLFGLMESVMVDPEEFAELLEGKRARIRGYSLDFMGMMASGSKGTDSRSVPALRFSETWIERGRVVQWTPHADVSRDSLVKTFESTPASADAKTKGLNNAKMVTTAIILYANDYDDVFPKAGSTDQAKQVVQPYLKSLDVWQSSNPEGGRLLYNTHLSGVATTSLDRPDSVPVLWDEKPWPDGGRIVGFADGHAKYVTVSAWNNEIWLMEQRRRTMGVKLAPPLVPKPAKTVKSITPTKHKAHH